MIKYVSTRSKIDGLNSAQAIIKGISKDKGLFVPTEIPKLSIKLEDMKDWTYQEVALEVISKFLPDFPTIKLKEAIINAYDEKFEAEDIVPIVKAGGAYFLELYHGKTAAFKDMALSILPYLMKISIEKEGFDKKVAILTATSGDTGKAALAGFAGVKNTEIIVFYPKAGVSQVQERQMITQAESNAHVFGINGNFDDAQSGVKEIFSNEAFGKELLEKGYQLSSANSINIGRLVPQVVYYVYSYVQLLKNQSIKNGDEINVVVPTGNFGNILAAYYAKEMGIPIKKFICASNKNKVLTDFINTGIYDINRDFYITNTPSMDILISSNLERMLYHLSGNNCFEIYELMEALEKDKNYEVSAGIKAGLKDFYGGFADEASTNDAIGKLYKNEGYLMDTHTAVAYKVYEDYKKETGDNTVAIIASTASAYKFANSVAEAIGLSKEEDEFSYIEALHKKTGIRIPRGLKNLKTMEIRHREIIEKDELLQAIRQVLK